MSNFNSKIETDYLRKIYFPAQQKKIVDKTARAILSLNSNKKINAIAFTGTSGAAVAYPVSYITGIPLLCVRKSKTDNHYHETLEGYTKPKNYVIIDDCVCTGKTIKKVKKSIEKYSPKSKLQMVFLYADSYSDTTELEREIGATVKIVGRR